MTATCLFSVGVDCFQDIQAYQFHPNRVQVLVEMFGDIGNFSSSDVRDMIVDS